MANFIASNNSVVAGKWLPYYHKPYDLGSTGTAAPDGTTYITQESGTSDANIRACITSPLNCGYFYDLIFFAAGGSRFFYILKMDADGVVDTLWAKDTSGNDRYWNINSRMAITIDIGVIFCLDESAEANVAATDRFRIITPKAETVDKNRIYHGGYSTFIRIAPEADENNYTDVFPTNLKGKNISVFSHGNTLRMSSGVDLLNGVFPIVLATVASSTGNKGQSLWTEWSIDESHATSSLSPTITSWLSGEQWQLGSKINDDIDPTSDFDDIPGYASISSQDTVGALGIDSHTTGTLTATNISISGRAGLMRFKTSYEPAAGAEMSFARNQFIQIIVMIS